MSSIYQKANSFIGVPVMQYGVSVLRIFSLFVLTRALDAEGYGDYTYLTTMVGLLLTMSYAGAQSISLRLYSHDDFDHNEVYTYSVKTGLFASAITLIIFPFFLFYSNTNLVELEYWLIIILALFSTPTQILTQVHNAFNKQKGNYVKVKLAEFAGTLFFIIAISIAFFLNHLNLRITLILYIIQSITIFLVARNKYEKTNISKRLKKKFKLDFIKLYPSGLFAYMVSSADLIMLGLLSTNTNVGYYGVAVRVYSILVLFPGSINMFFSSRIGDKDFFNKGEYAKYSRLTISVCIITALGVYIFSEFIIRVIAGPNYSPSVSILKILSIAFIFRSASYVLAAKWIHLEKYTFLSKVSSINGTLNVSLNFIFIPTYGAIAAAYTSLFSYSIGFLVNMYLLNKEKPKEAFISDYLFIQKDDIKYVYKNLIKYL